MEIFMQSTLTFIKNITLITVILYVTFAGLLTILAILTWVSWPFVGEWLGRIGLIAALLVLLSSVVTILTGLIRR